MAEVANLPQAPASEHSSTAVAPAAVAALAADIPKENLKNEANDLSSGGPLGTSPNQEKSSNSHHHDSEYDTASDLEGGAHDDYDDDDDDDGDEEEEDDDDDSLEDAANTDTDSVEFDAERQRGDGQEQTEYSKKVDEDRSNPQYIPKKGTFYEHDDRTADEPDVVQTQAAEPSEVGENKSASPTTISQASKTMKKWQPASGVDRWSHDRFDAGEQAPKSRAELVSSYGYDIRNEDGPPRARRRRRYARGPSKYSRNWEDETAYIKASNAQRKPPKPEDFPALEERQKQRKSRSYRDEKENRFERHQSDRARVAGGPQQQMPNRENKEHVRRSVGNPKNYRSGVRQPPMEFKNKNRPSGGRDSGPSHVNNRGNNSIIDKDVVITRSIINQPGDSHVETSFQKASNVNKLNMQQSAKMLNNQQQQPYNGFEHGQSVHQSPQAASGSGYNSREMGEKFTNNNHNSHSRQPVINPNSSNLSARLQQAQNRNDPSHVGSVQMHTLANQQHNAQVVNQNAMQNTMLDLQQQQQQQQQQQVVNQQEHGRTKRYSSLRQRSQHEAAAGVPGNQHMDQHTLQQLHMQHEQQTIQQQQIQAASNVHPQQQLMLQEPHMIPANLMQLYHQENLQAQMQALQVSGLPQSAAAQQPPAPKQPYTAIQQQYSAGSSGPPAAAYYTAPTPDYSSPPPAAVPPQAQYTPQPAAFLQSQAAAAPLAFNPTAAQSLNQGALTAPIAASAPAQVPPGGVNYVQTAAQSQSAAPTAGYQNYPNYQNINTIGGTTYFVPSLHPPARPVVLPPKRPIPILAPSEKTKRAQDASKEEDSKGNNSTSAMTSSTSSNASASAPIGSAENIDHILDNMFVQRPPYQPQTRKSSSPPSDETNKAPTTSGSAVPVDRTHDSSTNLPDQSDSSATKQSTAVEATNPKNPLALVTANSGVNVDSGPAEMIGKQSVPQ